MARGGIGIARGRSEAVEVALLPPLGTGRGGCVVDDGVTVMIGLHTLFIGGGPGPT